MIGDTPVEKLVNLALLPAAVCAGVALGVLIVPYYAGVCFVRGWIFRGQWR